MINDSFIRNFFIHNNRLKSRLINSIEHNVDSEIHQYIIQRYNDNCSFRESLARIVNYLDECPKCKVCNKSLTFTNLIRYPYQQYCSSKCSANSNETKKLREKTCLNRYGVKNVSQCEKIKLKKEQTCFKNHGVKTGLLSKRTKETMLNKYGVPHNWQKGLLRDKLNQKNIELYGNSSAQSKEVIEQRKLTNQLKYGGNAPACDPDVINKMSYTCIEKYNVPFFIQSQEFIDKTKETCKEKYGVEYFQKTDEFKSFISTKMSYLYEFGNILDNRNQTCQEKYGCNCYQQTDEFKVMISNIMLSKAVQEKRHETFVKNKTFNTSKPEQQTYELLKTKFKEVKYQYRDKERYPFNCDFYIPSLDLFIECQYSWTHGSKPYNEIEDKEKLELWKSKAKTSKYYQNAINTWTIRDVNKRKVANQNNLRLLEFFSYNDFLEWFNMC